jgi:hypothetical protein
VHDYGDRLTLNYAKDYPGGVNIQGRVQLEEIIPTGGQIRVEGEILVTSRPEKVISNTPTTLEIKHDTILVTSIMKMKNPRTSAVIEKTSVLDLVQAILDLQSKVKTLEEEIIKLKNSR